MTEQQPDESLPAIAVIGLSGRFPGAPNVETFWNNLCQGIEAISVLSDDELRASGVPDELLALPNFVKSGGVLEKPEWFDAAFFGYTPREAESMDPQHRIFLECAWDALENAGHQSEAQSGAVGVFAGTGLSHYLLEISAHRDQITNLNDLQVLIGNDKDFLATRVAYKFNLKGPGITVQTACSTSLVAVCLACQSLLNYQSDMALAGGITVHFPQAGYLYEEGGILSPDGHCRAFDIDSHGTTNGNGVGVVVLKRLEDAQRDGDSIRAVIRGFALNNDGADKVGYTAPSVNSQAEVIAMAQAMADVSPDTITYIETHGTGTTLGDPIEVAALTQAYRLQTERKNFCALGSVKTNVGHLDAAAGVTSLIKLVLSLENRKLPPSLHFTQPNPKINFADSPFYVNAALTDWQSPDGQPLRGGVSSFGIGGTNAHLVVEEAPRKPTSSDQAVRDWHLIALSAKTPTALHTLGQNLAEYFQKNPQVNLADAAYTLQVGRRAFPYRRMVVCQQADDAIQQLKNAELPASSEFRDSAERPLVFMFPGQGAQYANMGCGLYETEPVFRAEVDRCAQILQPHLGLDIRASLYASDAENANLRLEQTALAQPALFVTEYALAKLWMSWGLKPQSMIGHSLGEYSAACLAGVFTLEDALKLVAMRGQLMQKMPAGAMLAVMLSEKEVLTHLTHNLALAAVNEPGRCVVSGPAEAIAALEEQLVSQGIACRRLHTSHAFHSSMMDAIIQPFTDQVRQIKRQAPQIPFISNVTGTWITPAEAVSPEYWGGHLRQAVRFADGLQTILKNRPPAFLEVGPGQTLSVFARQQPAKDVALTIVPSLRHPKDTRPDQAFLFDTLGSLWTAGVNFDWESLYAGQTRQRIPLPGYPFERQRYWLDFTPKAAQPQAEIETLGKKADLTRWFYLPSWKQTPPPVFNPALLSQKPPLQWLIFRKEEGLSLALLQTIEQLGHTAIQVTPGEGFRQLDPSAYQINPEKSEDYLALLSALEQRGNIPSHWLHLWNIDSQEPDETLSQGFYSLMKLAQALGQRQNQAPIRLGVITTDMQPLSNAAQLCPEKATLLGPCKVIPQEYAQMVCQSIDLTVSAKPALRTRAAQQIVAELTQETPDAVIAYRDQQRWLPVFDALPIASQAQETPIVLREKGVYLITGGLGGVGLEIAEFLAHSVRARLALMGRSPFPERAAWETWVAEHGETDEQSQKILRLKSLETLGADVLTIQADVSDENQMRAVLAQIQSRFGALHGVVHSAGRPGGGMIQLMTDQEAAQILSPKVKGTQVLAELLQNTPLDFWMLCSSLIAISGGFGRAVYCAANAYLDTFAAYYTAQYGIPTISVNWDTWQGIGMAATPTSYRRLKHPLLEKSLRQTPNQAIFVTEFSAAKHWVLSEHQIMGKFTVPGTTYLEMVGAAFTEQTSLQQFEIEDVFFLNPLRLTEHEQRAVYTFMEKDADAYRFRIASQINHPETGQAAWQEHAHGHVHATNAALPRQYRIADLQAQLPRQHIPRSVEEETLKLGPRWKSLISAQRNSKSILAALELPAAFDADLQTYTLHPALLDEAITADQLVSDGLYLPLSYARIRVLRPLEGKIYSYAVVKGESQETVQVDLVILDAEGNELVGIEDFTLKRVADEAALKLTTGPVDAIETEVFLETGESNSQQYDQWVAELLPNKTGEVGMLPSEGVDAFRRILTRPNLTQIAVCCQSLPAWIAWVNSLTQDKLAENPNQGQSSASRPARARPSLPNPYVSPENEIQRSLANVWQDVLGVAPIGIQDNFFGLGGDSLLGIQVLAKAKQAGLRLNAQELFQYQTIAELSAILEASRAIQAEQGVVGGNAPLIPVQRWFFERNLAEPQHFNQALLLKANTPLHPEHLRQAFQALAAHHDALRLRYFRDGTGWRQEHLAEVVKVNFTVEDLSHLPANEQTQALENSATRAQVGLNLSEGPLMRVVLYQMGVNNTRLLIVIHHLIIDIGAWQILLEDLQMAYSQFQNGQAIQLPPKTTSLKRYGEYLKEKAGHNGVVQQLDYWLAPARRHVSLLPLDDAAEKSVNTEESARQIVAALTVDETQTLLREVPQAYRTSTEEVLLAALTQTLSVWVGSSSILVDIEGNGRALREDEIDLSRTVGWFTYIYPALLYHENATPSVLLPAIKEQLRAIPNSGFDYGVLRYSGQPDGEARFHELPQAEVNFLYVGSLDDAQSKATLFNPTTESTGFASSPRNLRRYVLEVEVIIMNNCLQWVWTYSAGLHRPTTIQALADGALANLRALIEHCLSPEAGKYTPSDFGEASIDQAALDDLMNEFGNFDEDDGV